MSISAGGLKNQDENFGCSAATVTATAVLKEEEMTAGATTLSLSQINMKNANESQSASLVSS
jgi:hypothetical protein